MPINCRWKRRIGAHIIEIPGINGHKYHTSADDIGMDIVCMAEPFASAGDVGGTACGEIGPFELDPITRLSLENLISSGGSRFPVRHFRETDDPHPRDLQIHVTQDYVKVVHPGPESKSQEVVSPFSADYPKVVLHPLDTLKFRLELGEEREKVYHFVALSRTSRDTIALLIRCFHSRRYVATSFILSRLFQNPATPGAPLTTMQGDSFDVHRLTERLAKELDRTVGKLDAVARVVQHTNREKEELQEQLRETIRSYTEAIEKLHQQIATNRGGPAAELPLKLGDAKGTQSRLTFELHEIRQQLAEEQEKKSAGFGTEAEVIKSEIAKLRSGINALTGDGMQNSLRDSSRAEELRRLRQDVDGLLGEKDILEQSLQQAEKEKQELIENFLYVKGCLDKLQMASLQIQPVSAEMERELQQARQAYSQAVDERNRTAVRVESLDRDHEKQKTQCEAALERVMTANARLMEERDRLQKEAARISSLYQSTMLAMGATTDPSAPSAAAGVSDSQGGSGDCTAELEALRAEFAQKTELLNKRAQESEGLRTRLRKLAMV